MDSIFSIGGLDPAFPSTKRPFYMVANLMLAGFADRLPNALQVAVKVSTKSDEDHVARLDGRRFSCQTLERPIRSKTFWL